MGFGFTLSDEQEELRRSVRRFLAERSPEAEVRRLMTTAEGYDPVVWELMADQLGLQSLVVPEEYGGSGYSYLEQVIVLEEMGAALLCAPYFSSAVLAAGALLELGDEAAARDLLPGIASGRTIATLALAGDAGRWDPEAAAGTVAAVASGGQWRLDGHKSFVLDGHVADLVLVVAGTEDGVGLFAVDSGAPGLSRAPLSTMDQTRKQARLVLHHVPARLVGVPGNAAVTRLRRALGLAVVGLAAEGVGGTRHCLERAVAHATTRVQFGRPIGSFQAIKHKCADMLVELESARSVAYYGAWVAAGGADDLALVASLVKAYCSPAYFHVAAENIQIHGAMGFTWEHDAHLYFKRAKSSELLLGDPAAHRVLLAEHLGL